NFTVLIHLARHGPCRTHLVLGDLAVLVCCGTGPRESAALMVGRTHTTVPAISAHCAFDKHDDRVDGPYRMYGVVWKANPKLIAWYTWISPEIPIEGSVDVQEPLKVEISP